MRLLSLASHALFVLLLTACNPPEPPPDAPAGPRCCEDRGSCISTEQIDESVVELLDIDGCAQPALCVPDELFLPLPASVCTLSRNGGEGRCLPACLLAAVEEEASARDGCAADQRCMPCYDPVDGAATGACSIHTDRPKRPAPPEPAPCCAGAGRCTPAHLVTDKSGLLGQDTCAAGALCVAQGTSLLASETSSDGCLK